MNHLTVPVISVSSLSELLKDNSTAIQLIDVREAHERDICHIGGVHIPLGALQENLQHIDTQQPVIIYCRSGGRSLYACRQLIEAGYTDVTNVEGGILSWIQEIDPSLQAY